MAVLHPVYATSMNSLAGQVVGPTSEAYDAGIHAERTAGCRVGKGKESADLVWCIRATTQLEEVGQRRTTSTCNQQAVASMLRDIEDDQHREKEAHR